MQIARCPRLFHILDLSNIKWYCLEGFRLLIDSLQCCKAIGADALVFVKGDAINVGAEHAGRFIFLQNNASFVGEDLQCVAYVDVHALTNFSRQNNSAKLVYFSYHSS